MRRWLTRAEGARDHSAVASWLVVGGLLLVVAVAGSVVLAEGMARRFTALDLTRVPLPAPPYQPASPLSETWPVVRMRGLSVTVPPALRYPRLATAPPGTLVLTDRWQTTWLSITPRRSSGRWAAPWYRHCLYTRHDPLGLLGKALIIPPLGTPTPRLVDQRIGAWQAYLYLTPARLAADLFDGRHHVTLVYAGRRESALDVDTVRAIVASLRVSP